MQIRVVIADDHPVMLAGLQYLLKQHDGFSLAGRAQDSSALVELLSRGGADVVVTDFSMPGGRYGDGIALLRFLQRRFPQIRLVVLTAMENPVVLASILEAGVECVMSKIDAPSHLVPTLLAAMEGSRAISPSVQAALDGTSGESATVEAPKLSRRESEVLRMYAEGLSVMAIAERVGRSRKTVSTQKVAAMRKLGLGSDAEVFQYAIANGLVAATRSARLHAGETDG